MQSSSTTSRKRTAGGATAIAAQPQPQPQSDQIYDFNQDPAYANVFDYSGNGYIDPSQGMGDQSLADPNAYASNLNSLQYDDYSAPDAPGQTSTELVKRTRNQDLTRATPHEQWAPYGTTSNQTDDEDEQELERRVAAAKRDAQGKRKQIPPFVQKLSSFLDSGNTDLIRWSDDGRSFIVIDEDEFARTLIPELFKHNNYASFVRQLNMYGFHKTVNITDGSLRQSEKARKGVKPPSMYSHPYFRRNRPDLLWLIQKPSSKTTGKRRRDGTTKGDYDSDEERAGSPPNPDVKPLGDLGRTTSSEMVTLPKSELAQVRRELMELRRQQKYIRDVIEGLKKQNDQFYRQATQSQALHERHENSINAILTFLATFYNRSLEGHAGQNLVNMFTGLGQQTNKPQGSVVEDIGESTQDTNSQMQRYRKTPLLLGPPTSVRDTSSQPIGSISTAPASNRSSVSPAVAETRRSTRLANSNNTTTNNNNQNYQSSPYIKNEALTPNSNFTDNDQMMSLINNVNANSPGTTTPNLDFSAALDHYQNANGQAPLTPQQRNDVLSMMAANQQNNVNNKNALTTPTAPAMPDLNQYKETQAQLDMLQNMQKAQDERVQELNRRLQPLSPTGAIPGLGDGGDGAGFFDATGGPGDFDPDSFLNFDNNGDIDFDFGNGGVDNGVNWDFGNDGPQENDGAENEGDDGAHLQPGFAADRQGHSRVESVSSAAASPADAAASNDEPSTPSKRQRRS